MTRQWRRFTGLVLASVLIAGAPRVAQAAWEPTKPIEFVIPAGTGGGADQMARLIAGLAEKHKLSPRPLIVVNKSGGAGAEGFLHVKGKKGDAHTIIITLSNLFTTPLHTGVPLHPKKPPPPPPPPPAPLPTGPPPPPPAGRPGAVSSLGVGFAGGRGTRVWRGVVKRLE